MPGRTMGREESRREARKGKGRRQTQSPSSSQIADLGGGDVSGGEMRGDMDEEGPLSLARAYLLVVTVVFACCSAGRASEEQREEGRAQERQAAGGQAGRAPRRTCLESLVPR